MQIIEFFDSPRIKFIESKQHAFVQDEERTTVLS